MTKYNDLKSNPYLFYDYIPVGICIINKNYNIKFWNRSLEGWTATNRNEYVGKNLLDIFPHLKLPKFKARFDLMFQGRPPMVFSALLNHHIFPIVNVNGDSQAQSATLTSLPAETAGEYDVLIAIENVTTLFNKVKNYRQIKNQAVEELQKRREAEDKIQQYTISLEKLNATKDKFFSIIAHDLINPIYSQHKMINVFIENLSDFDCQDIREMLEQLSRSSSQTYKLLENLLTWSRSQLNRIECNIDLCRVLDVVKRAASDVGTNAAMKKINLSIEIDESLCALCDVNMFNTVLRNLISNAIKFTNYGGKIIVRGIELKNTTEIIVEDNGVGMPKEVADNLFKLDKSRSMRGTNDEAGTGLGLIICKEFVEKMGGKISAESELGIGSKFILSFPNKAE